MNKLVSALLVSVLLVVVLSWGCSKDSGCKPVSPESEKAQIEQFMAANGLDSFKISNNIYYKILNPGAGPVPNLNSIVEVTYIGLFMNGNIFDQSPAAISFPLNQVIEGWQLGIPLIKKGGHITLIIPSSYAYGCVGNGSIPPNSVLYFDINLIDVK